MSYKKSINKKSLIRKKAKYNVESKMTVKVKDLTIEELQKIIFETVNEAIEEKLEDLMALASDEYLKSIEEARKEYKEGKVTKLEELL